MDRGTRAGDRLRRPTGPRGPGSKGFRMLTRQKAEPMLGMKLTLLRSGHKKRGRSCGGLVMVSSDTLTFSQPSGGSLLNM